MNGILVIGDIIIDNYLVGGTKRISPEAPVPVVNISEERFELGGAGNVVNNLLAFDANVDILSVIGDDQNALLLDNLFQEKNINKDYLILEKNRSITKKTRVISSNQQIVRYDQETTKEISQISFDKVLEIYKSIVKDYNILILSDYGKGVLTNELTPKIIEIAKANDVKVLVDPKGADYSKYKGAYILTPNKKEASIATNLPVEKENLLPVMEKLKSTYNISIPIVTLSQDGIAVYDNQLKLFPTQVKEVYDVTGAGDTVIAAIAYKLMQNTSIDEAIEFANLAAGIVIGKLGVATATIDEIYATSHPIKSGIEIQAIAKRLKSQNKKIVFTNGCFDILHLGHVQYLEKAKSLGDILIVGINTDDSVRKLKGKSRPINPEYDRAYLLSALNSVDYTVLFDEETPYKLIQIIQPDVLVKGNDYKNKKVVGSDIVPQVTLIEFTEGKSTTNMIQKIRDDI